MEKIERYAARMSLLAVLTGLVGATVLIGQTPTPDHEQKHGQSSSVATPGEIFCLAKSAGQLCTHGSAEVLKLEGAKKARWSELAGRYNTAVDAATKQLLKDAKATLSPDEFATVEKWFEKSLNAQLNRQLLPTER